MSQENNEELTVEDKVLESGPLETFFSNVAIAKVMDFLITSQEFDYSETDIARYSGISLRTLQRDLSKLLEFKLIKQTRSVGNAKMYQLNKSHKAAMAMENLLQVLADERIEQSLKVIQEPEKISA